MYVLLEVNDVSEVNDDKTFRYISEFYKFEPNYYIFINILFIQ